MYRSPRLWLAIGVAVAGTIGVATAAYADCRASITATFGDSCRDVAAHASKDISHVVIRYADGRVVKDETVDSHDYTVDGGPGDEILSVTVKAARTVKAFDCQPTTSPPLALLESRRCGFGACGDWTAADSDGSHERCSHVADSIPFRGVNSTDPDGDIVSWSIDFGDGSPPANGTWAGSPPIDVGHVFPITADSLFTVTLTLTDSAGLTGTDTLVVCAVDFTPD